MLEEKFGNLSLHIWFSIAQPTSDNDMKFLSATNNIIEITPKLKFLFMTSKDEILTLYSVFEVLLDLGPF